MINKKKTGIISIMLAAAVVTSTVIVVVVLQGKNPDGNTHTQTAFISRWNTQLTSTGSSAANQVKLPLESTGTYNFTLDWGDNSTNNTITAWNQTEVTHTYNLQGIYTIKILGTIIGWRFNDAGDKHKIIEIKQWGCLRFGNSGAYFLSCMNLNLTATDAPDLTGTTSLQKAFSYCMNLGSSGNINGWDVSKVTNMHEMLNYVTTFNQPISAWDVSSVTDMANMFYQAAAFNQPIGSWDVSKVTTMEGMFGLATSFNQPLGSWNVSRVTTMVYMFQSVTLSTVNYSNLLNGWAALAVQSSVTLDAGSSKYSAGAPATAKQHLITSHSWTINDAGQAS